jgi:nucleoid DNA-binding protein
MISKALAEKINASNSDWSFEDSDVQRICEGFCQYIIDNVKRGETVNLTNFAKFARALRKERTFTSPNDKTNKITKPDRYALSITVMAGVKEEFEKLTVNGDNNDEVIVDEEDAEPPVAEKSKEKKSRKKSVKKSEEPEADTTEVAEVAEVAAPSKKKSKKNKDEEKPKDKEVEPKKEKESKPKKKGGSKKTEPSASVDSEFALVTEPYNDINAHSDD